MKERRHTKYEIDWNIKTIMKLSVLFKHKFTDKNQKSAKNPQETNKKEKLYDPVSRCCWYP